MSGLVTCTIDGIEVEVPRNTLIIRAAEEAGIMIPRFCDHPLLKPVAACRQCLVDVASPAGPEGKLRAFPKPQPACAIAVTPGMVVATQLTSAGAKEAQEQVAELILINHPLDCPVCDKGGECPLQNQAMATGRPVSRFADKKNTFPKPLALTPQILLDRERCVLCQRCTRFALEVAGDPFIALQRRGANQQIGRYDAAVLGFATSPSQVEDALAGALEAVDGQPFAGYFAGNIIQICPVGALTSAAYRFRARPFDLVSTETVAEHDANGSAIRVDYRRGAVLRRQAGADAAVNQEWITDKDRFGFRWQVAADRLTRPLVRQEGKLAPVAWPVAVAAAARILEQAPQVGVLPGGRLTLEDGFAYAEFARRVLGTDNVDFRARPASAEEAQFLAHHVAGSGLGVTFDQLVAAPAVLLVGFEPEDEGGIVFLRLRQAGTKVLAAAAHRSRGLERLGANHLPVAPGGEARFLADLPAGPLAGELAGGVIVVGERLATVPGAYSQALAAAKALGAKLVWIPRRAGERAAVEAGLLPGLLPGGRAPEAVDREAALRLFGREAAPAGGLDLVQMIAAAQVGELDALLVGGLELADLPDPAAAAAALGRAKVVALQVRGSEVAEYADVVLPVAPPQEKAGTYLNWEGRARPFPQVLTSTALSDARVLQAIANRLGFGIELARLGKAHQVLAELGAPRRKAAAPEVAPEPARELAPGEALLSSWRQLVDDAAGLAEEPHLAASAPAPRAVLSPATAAGLGLAAGGQLAVSTARGQIRLPLALDAAMPEGVVHLPAKSPGSWVLATLGAAHGAVVKLAQAAPEPDQPAEAAAAEDKEAGR
ncbi:MAG: NADH-quinone oxidoreductase subunit G [Bifidobacteriaceae bacterium]|nr:NADH-quinone oxidoreductase subunit G [Bifidobacteriaceae bacterium]